MPTFDLPPRFQFSLRNMLIAVAVLAVLLGLFAVAGGILAWLLAAVVIWILPTPLVVFAVYARGDLRAFAIGALVPWVSLWTSQYLGSSVLSVVGQTLQLLVMAAICGAVAIAMERGREFFRQSEAAKAPPFDSVPIQAFSRQNHSLAAIDDGYRIFVQTPWQPRAPSVYSVFPPKSPLSTEAVEKFSGQRLIRQPIPGGIRSALPASVHSSRSGFPA